MKGERRAPGDKTIRRVLVRYTAAAAAIALLLLAVNVLAAGLWLYSARSEVGAVVPLARIGDELARLGGDYVLSAQGAAWIDARYQWAMLLDGQGRAVWEYRLPEDVPRRYTLGQVAGFSRWYLQDYPVYVWQKDGGLLVLGMPKGSVWKQGLELPMALADRAIAWLPQALALNCALALGMALLLGLLLARSLRPLARGIEPWPKTGRWSCPPAAWRGIWRKK